MRLVSAEYFIDLDWREKNAIQIVIESPELMTMIVEDIYTLCNGTDGSFVLSKDNKEINAEKNMEIIINPFCLDFSNKQIQNKLYSEIVSAEEAFIIEKNEINSAIVNYLDKISSLLTYDLINYDLNLDTTKLLKMYDVKISPECFSLTERVIEYIKVVALLLRKKLVVFINLSSFINENDISDIIEMAEYYNICILFIENQDKHTTTDIKTFILDKDRCLIEK